MSGPLGDGRLRILGKEIRIIDEDKSVRRRAKSKYMVSNRPGFEYREELSLLINAVLDSELSEEVKKDVEEVFNFLTRQIPDHPSNFQPCILSDGKSKYTSIRKLKFKKFYKLDAIDQKKVDSWIRQKTS